MAAIELTHVTVRYGDVLALDDVSFAAPTGAVTGLVGRNGAGKSTSILLMAGLLEPLAGGVRVLGRSFDDASADIRARTGYLLSDPALFGYLTPVETLRFLGEAYGLDAAEAARRTDDLLGVLELQDARGRVVNGFSTGMQKRLAIAAALVHAPELLVLDEPFESLDPLMVRRIRTLLAEYAQNGGSVLLSSHLIAAVEEICDHVVILDRGRALIAESADDARARAADAGAVPSLERTYASLVHEQTGPPLTWLTARRAGG